jgi:hypothetical protein
MPIGRGAGTLKNSAAAAPMMGSLMIRDGASAHLHDENLFSCGRAVDERDAALTQGAALWRVV